MGVRTTVKIDFLILKSTVFQRCDGLRMAFPADLRHLFHITEPEAMGGARRDAGGFQSLIHSIHAIVAFDDLSGFRIPLGSPPGAGGNTGLAAHAKAVVHKNDAVTAALLHGARRAGGHTPGIFTMKAGHKNIRGTGKTTDHLRPDLDDLAQSGSDRQVLVGFALNFAGMASDAFLGVLK
jgi:hypothetical protein